MSKKKMTMGLIVGNRGFFPDHLADSGPSPGLELPRRSTPVVRDQLPYNVFRGDRRAGQVSGLPQRVQVDGRCHVPGS